MYELLLQHVGVDIAALRACAASPDANNQCETSGAYNLILTEDYMFIVRRSGLSHLDSVNSMSECLCFG